MTCDAIRDRLDGATPDAVVAAHLDRCPACRAEASFRRRVAAAVVAMPPVNAPTGFAARVMARLPAETADALPAPQGVELVLRPWELGGIVAVCLALLALLPMACSLWAPMVLERWRWLSAGSVTWGAMRHRLHSLADGGQTAVADLLARGGGVPLAWLCGAVAFAVALYLLLSWRTGGFAGSDVEDAYA